MKSHLMDFVQELKMKGVSFIIKITSKSVWDVEINLLYYKALVSTYIVEFFKLQENAIYANKVTSSTLQSSIALTKIVSFIQMEHA